VTNARFTPTSRTIARALQIGENTVHVGGNATGDLRREYGDMPADTGRVDGEYLADAVGYAGFSFAERELERWRQEFPSSFEAQLLDFLYWEQRDGNWGGQRFTEDQLAFETVAPFNSRSVTILLYSVPRVRREGDPPSIYKSLIKHTWPELLDYPINPHQESPKRHKLVRYGKQMARRILPETVADMVRQWM